MSSKYEDHELFPFGPFMLKTVDQFEHNGTFTEVSSVILGGNVAENVSISYVSPRNCTVLPYYEAVLFIPTPYVAKYLLKYPDFIATYLSESRHTEAVKVELPEDNLPGWFIGAFKDAVLLHDQYWSAFENTTVEVRITPNVSPVKRFPGTHENPGDYYMLYTGVEITETWPDGRVEVLHSGRHGDYHHDPPTEKDHAPAHERLLAWSEEYHIRRDMRPDATIAINILLRHE